MLHVTDREPDRYVVERRVIEWKPVSATVDKRLAEQLLEVFRQAHPQREYRIVKQEAKSDAACD